MSASGRELRGLGALASDIGLYPMAELRANLDALAKPTDEFATSRDTVRQVLGAVLAALGPAFEERTRVDDALVVVTPHWSMAALEALGDALADLDRGTTPVLLKKAAGGSGAALSTEERKRDEALIGALPVLSAAGLCKDGRPEVFLAAKLAGLTRRGKPITARVLRNLRSNIRQRKEVADMQRE
jgi:hypothetical protein